jgi:hypothetical protein
VKRAFAALALLGCALPATAEEAVVNGFRMHMEQPDKFNRNLEAFMKLKAER